MTKRPSKTRKPRDPLPTRAEIQQAVRVFETLRRILNRQAET